MHFSIHWLRAHHVTYNSQPTNNILLMHNFNRGLL